MWSLGGRGQGWERSVPGSRSQQVPLSRHTLAVEYILSMSLRMVLYCGEGKGIGAGRGWQWLFRQDLQRLPTSRAHECVWKRTQYVCTTQFWGEVSIISALVVQRLFGTDNPCTASMSCSTAIYSALHQIEQPVYQRGQKKKKKLKKEQEEGRVFISPNFNNSKQ